jgi:hypothetical protein
MLELKKKYTIPTVTLAIRELCVDGPSFVVPELDWRPWIVMRF